MGKVLRGGEIEAWNLPSGYLRSFQSSSPVRRNPFQQKILCGPVANYMISN